MTDGHGFRFSGFRVQQLGFRDQDFRSEATRKRWEGLRLRFLGLGFRVRIRRDKWEEKGSGNRA